MRGREKIGFSVPQVSNTVNLNSSEDVRIDLCAVLSTAAIIELYFALLHSTAHYRILAWGGTCMCHKKPEETAIKSVMKVAVFKTLSLPRQVTFNSSECPLGEGEFATVGGGRLGSDDLREDGYSSHLSFSYFFESASNKSIRRWHTYGWRFVNVLPKLARDAKQLECRYLS